ncbi:LysE family translocator [Neisseria leonii]|uniref:LysE family translocator n=1 Tax=Neisseria leonii TaxID=2995413 RepID=A0A9X4DZV1_9NEIS|nr:LysE family translocator [Neisseria sp. 51.81]MDD9326898.1 LysE family translocator [Neisseria sp. 51.81]
MSQQTLFTYVLTCIIAAATPGPGTMSVVVYAATAGWRKTLPVIFGVQAGMLAMALLALSGVTAALLASPQWFAALQYFGAAYIAWLGVMSLLAARRAAYVESAVQDRGAWRNFRHGMTVTFAGPKTLLFFTSFFPLFIDHTQAVPPQMAVLLFILLFCTLAVHLVYCFCMNKISRIFRQYNRQFHFGVGMVFLLMAAYMAGIKYGTGGRNSDGLAVVGVGQGGEASGGLLGG